MKTILLVDDERSISDVLEEILNSLGYQVIATTGAESAMSVIREGTHIDLVLTDYRLPGMNGLEFIAVLKKVLPSVPVIILTSYGSVEVYLKSLSLGVFEYLNKPVEVKELEHTLKLAFERSDAGSAPRPSRARSCVIINQDSA